MMNKSKIDWCDFSWNPITGCLHECTYCYAKKQARRFCGDVRINKSNSQLKHDRKANLWTLEKPYKNAAGKILPFPAGFEPTLHEYRLPMPAQKKKPANIFVCSMADLFAEWVPDEWIKLVFAACEAAPQHKYLFLTKNGQRYEQLGLLPDRENFWYGTTRTGANPERECGASDKRNRFLSIEPLLAPIDKGTLNAIEYWGWVIIGAETGNRKDKVIPSREWIDEIVQKCKETKTPVFMKDNLLEIWKDTLIQEYPAPLQPKNDIIPHCDGCEHHKATERHYNSVKDVTAMNHFCTAKLAHKRVPGRYARTSPPWCPKRG